MISLLDLDFKDLRTKLQEQGYPAYKAGSILSWVFQKNVFDFEQMTDLSKTMRTELAERYRILSLELVKMDPAADQESFKFLFRTLDGLLIETVLIVSDDPEERLTVCVSSQVGCALGCTFCATGRLGWERDLTVSEILSQVLLADQFARSQFGLDTKERSITNVVFMGMGEPLLNFDAVKQAVLTLNFSGAFNLGKRHITLSTAGIIPGILRMAEELDQVRLAISLNSAHQDKRRVLMPLTQKYPLSELLDAVRQYQEITNRRVTFEYVLIEGINDDETDVLQLKRSLYKIKYNLNLIPYNENDEIAFSAPARNTLKQFRASLKKHGIPFVERYSKGQEIKAACGQLGLQYKRQQGQSEHN